MSRVPSLPVLALIILLAFSTATSSYPFDWGYYAVMPQSLRNSAISSLAKFVLPLVDSCSCEVTPQLSLDSETYHWMGSG